MKIVMFTDEAFQDNLNLIDTANKVVGAQAAKAVVRVVDCMEKAQHVPDPEPKPETEAKPVAKKSAKKAPVKKAAKRK